MYKYECSFCMYKTNLKGDYKRHLNSKKHQRNIKNTFLILGTLSLCRISLRTLS